MTKYFSLYKFKIKGDSMMEVYSFGTLWKYSEETMSYRQSTERSGFDSQQKQ
jgi:hypothetical protein